MQEVKIELTDFRINQTDKKTKPSAAEAFAHEDDDDDEEEEEEADVEDARGDTLNAGDKGIAASFILFRADSLLGP